MMLMGVANECLSLRTAPTLLCVFAKYFHTLKKINTATFAKISFVVEHQIRLPTKLLIKRSKTGTVLWSF